MKVVPRCSITLIVFDLDLYGMALLNAQAQMRELSGFVETRRQLLTLKPSHRNNWIGFAIAHHINHE